MSKPVFKVWVHIERVDEENDKYEDIELPECLFVAPSETYAKSIVERIVDFALNLK